jgi:ankyrin repeat protein
MKRKSVDPLTEAALRGDVEGIKTLLSQCGTRKNRKTLDTALGHAAKGGHVEAVALLLKAGADPDSKAVCSSLLIEAAEGGELAIVKLLVEAGADIHRKVVGADAFAAALEMDQVRIAEFLKSRGADWATAALRHACEHGDLNRARQALDAGANVESKTLMSSDTPLALAAGNGNTGIVRLLLKRGVNPNTKVEGKTALHDAVSGGNLETVNALVKAGANIHVDWYGETVLMAAASTGNLPMVRRLIELGAEVTARDKNRGMTTMDHAKTSKNKELIAYLNSLGAASERDAPRTLARALARKFGGKPVEHIAGFLLNARFHGTKCQFNIGSDGFSLFVHGLDFGESEFKRSKDGQILFSVAKPNFQRQKFEPVKGASAESGFLVFRTLGVSPLPVDFVKSFCARHSRRVEEMDLAKHEVVRLGANFASLTCPLAVLNLVEQRLKSFARLIEAISRPPQPERRLFASEWVLKPAPKSAATTRHQFGGKLEQPVACPHCGCATNLMAQIDLSDSLLPNTALCRDRLPVFWCLGCLEWDAAFFDLSGQLPRPFNPAGKKSNPPKLKSGEEDLPERQVTLVPVATGKKAARKSKLGGSPTWIQMEETQDCPKCKKPMGFVLQLASDSRISYGDVGMLYAFACPDCQITASLIQSH